MTDQSASIHVVQCPKCGSPLQAARPGEITVCSYCGSTLEMGVGASGYPIARMANIEASTAYLVRSEVLKRAREKLAEGDEVLKELRMTRAIAEAEIAQATRRSRTAGCTVFLGPFLCLVSLIILLAGESTCALLGIIAGLALWVYVHEERSQARKRIASLEEKAGQLARAESEILETRDRLEANAAQLEQELDDLASRL